MTDQVREALDKVRELSGDITDILHGGVPHDTMTYRGSLLWDLLDAAIVLQRALLADRSPDGREPVTADWLLAVGGERKEDTVKPYGDPSNPNHRFPKVRFGPFLWYASLWVNDVNGGAEATYCLKYDGACLGVSPDLTRDQFRYLCAGLGVPLMEVK